jgi:hypothetical protein
MNLIIDQVTLKPIDAGLLSNFHNLQHLNLTINVVDLENVKNTLTELAQLFKQANFQKLKSFVLNEKSSLGYAKDLIPAWIDLLAAIPWKDLQILDKKSRTDEIQLIAWFHSRNSLLLSHGIARLTCLAVLKIHHLGFDYMLIRILPYLPTLRKLDLLINMNMSNENVIDDLCHNLEKCNSLEEIAVYVPTEGTMMLDTVFMSLAKLQHFIRISLYFDSLEKFPADEFFQKLELIKKLQLVNLYVKKRVINRTSFYDIGQELKKK